MNLPDTCDCGSYMVTPFQPWHETRCHDCCRTSEEIINEHVPQDCETENCGWCVLVAEEVLS